MVNPERPVQSGIRRILRLLPHRGVTMGKAITMRLGNRAATIQSLNTVVARLGMN